METLLFTVSLFLHSQHGIQSTGCAKTILMVKLNRRENWKYMASDEDGGEASSKAQRKKRNNQRRMELVNKIWIVNQGSQQSRSRKYYTCQQLIIPGCSSFLLNLLEPIFSTEASPLNVSWLLATKLSLLTVHFLSLVLNLNIIKGC